MLSYVSVEDRVAGDHPIRKLPVLVDSILGELDEVLTARYAGGGRPSIPPERLLCAALGESQRFISGCGCTSCQWRRRARWCVGSADRATVQRGATLGADKGYDTQDFVATLRRRGIKPHIARHSMGPRSAVDYCIARGKVQVRKRIEHGFGWVNTIGGLRKLPLVALPKARR